MFSKALRKVFANLRNCNGKLKINTKNYAIATLNANGVCIALLLLPSWECQYQVIQQHWLLALVLSNTKDIN